MAQPRPTDPDLRGSPADTQPPPTGGDRYRDAVVAGGVGILEAMGLHVALQQGGTASSALLVHAGAVLTLGAWVIVLASTKREVSVALLAWVATLAAGPVGAIGAAVLALALPTGGQPGPLLGAWYERIALSVAVDPITRLCDDVAAGRSLDLASPLPQSFLDVMATGSLAERQNVLGLIARRFHPDYLPALKAALRSSEPVIRVQAAAVAAHIRPQLHAIIQVLIGDVPVASEGGGSALLLFRDLRDLTASGLLETSDKLRAIEIADRLGDVLISKAQRGGFEQRGQTLAAEHQSALEELLLSRGRFVAFRRLRTAGRVLAARPDARLRRLTVVAGGTGARHETQ